MSSKVMVSKSVKVLYQHVESSSSEEPSMEEWSSLIIGQSSDNPKRPAYEEGLYDPGSGEICTKYIQLSDSSVLRHVYYNYPGIKDPGITQALLHPEPQKVYDYDGQELYLALCDQMNVVPVRHFYRGLLKEAIDLKYYAVNPVGVRAMAMALTNNKYVKRLDLTGSFLSLDACYHLGQMLGESFALQELVLRSCKLLTEGVRNLVVMLSKRSLDLLDLSRNDIKDAGLIYLTTQITKGAVIRRLNLSYNDLGVDGALALAEAFEINNKVTILDVSWNRMYPAQGANPLIRILGDNKALKEVNLSWNGLTVGLPLRKLLTVATLKILDLSNNKLTTAAAKAIALRLPNATGLVTLDISNNPLRPADVLTILVTLRQRTVKVRNLLMDNIIVSKEFIIEKDEILRLSFRSETRITHGPVTKNYTLSVPDMRLIVMKRIEFLSARASKKCKLDIALFFLSTQKTNEGPDIQIRQLYKSLIVAGVRIEIELIEEMASLFPGKPTDKGAKTVNLPEYLLQKLEYESLLPDKTIPLLMSAAEEINIVREKLLDGNQLEKYSLARILILVCYNQPSEFVSTISYFLQYSRDDTTLALLVRIISGTITMHTPNDSPDINADTERYQNFIKIGVEYALRDAMLSDTQIKRCFVEGIVDKQPKTYLHYLCLNLITLLRWENCTRVVQLRCRCVGRAVECAARRVCAALCARTALVTARVPATAAATAATTATAAQLDQMPTCHALAEVLDRIDMSGTKAPPPSVEIILKMVQATVKYFFRCLHEEDIMDKLRGVQTACRLLRKLCLHSKLARAVALRDLLETAMFREEKVFGSRSMVTNAITTGKDWANEDLLIHLNQKHGPMTQLTQSHTSVFHAGVIGPATRRTSCNDDAQVPPALSHHTELLMGALMACMDGDTGVAEGATSVSLLLVELVSPDVMYNGLPWPDEDFTKQVSIERELYIRGAVSRSAVCGAWLWRAAAARPALCVASALLRAAAATLLHRLRAHLDRHTNSAEMARERAALTELLSTMTLGQLLPHPLCHMLELTPELSASELVQVLRECLWNYTRDHVPSPALFNGDSSGIHWRDPSTCKPPTTYTDALRLIIQKKISTLGHLYPIMFLNLEKDSN